MDIAAVARTCSEWPLLLAFLQRRHPAAHPTCDIKALLLTIVKVPLDPDLAARRCLSVTALLPTHVKVPLWCYLTISTS